MPETFEDRRHAGRVLSSYLSDHRWRSSTIVLALPRGGVPVGYEVARALALDLDVFVVRKLGYPGHEEYAMGAIASGGVRYLAAHARFQYGENSPAVREVVERERRELRRREREYRGDLPPLDVRAKTVILVDDGMATGASVRVAVTALRRLSPARIVVAVPVASVGARDEVLRIADEVVSAATPQNFSSVGEWYQHFDDTGDAEVQSLLARARTERARETITLSPAVRHA